MADSFSTETGGAIVSDTEYKHWRELPENRVNIVVPPVAVARITGVAAIKQDSRGGITVRYLNGSERSANGADFNIVGTDDFITLVGEIQDRILGITPYHETRS
jgi:hypothetical protein